MVCANCGAQNGEDTNVCRSCGLRIANPVAVSGEATLSNVEYAGFWKRAAAVSIDTLVLFVVGTVVGVVLIKITGSEEGLELVSNVIGIIIGWLYFSFMESSPRQATIGKGVMKLIVTDIKGERLSIYRASGRHFGKLVSSITLGVGFILAGYTQKKQALHDLMFDCLVIVKK
ncbi:MAG: RDD family protein [Thermodesulfobacteriota bacterium]